MLARERDYNFNIMPLESGNLNNDGEIECVFTLSGYNAEPYKIVI
jgi:hypothetical protein